MSYNSLVIYLFVIISLAKTSPVDGQNNPFVFRHITIEDGLASNEITDIIQDEKGFMWFATSNGLQKYDGYNFTSYHHVPSDSQSISSDNLLSLLEDNQKNIWTVSFLSGINSFDPVANKCIRISELNHENFKELFLAIGLCMDKRGNIWMIAADNIACYFTKTHQLSFYKNIFPKNLHPYFINIQYDHEKDQLWIGDANNGICMFDIEKKSFFNHDNNPSDLPIFRVKRRPYSIYIDRSKNLWIQNYSGDIIKYNLFSNTSTSYSLYETPANEIYVNKTGREMPGRRIVITAFKEDANGNIWMADGSAGLIEYDTAKDFFRIIPSSSGLANGLNYNAAIHCICEDREGNIWIGTDKGINIFNPSKQQFHFFDNDPDRKFPKIKNETMDFVQSNTGDLWVASWGGGIILFDSLLKLKKYIFHQDGPTSSIAEPGNRVWSLLKNPGDKIWIGCQHGYIAEADQKNIAVNNFHPEGLFNRTILNMRSDSSSNIWLALYSGIGRFNPKNNDATCYRKFISYRGVDSATASDIFPDHDGNIWVGTLGLGLQKFDVSKNRFTEIFVPDQNNANSISSSLINCIISLNDSLMAIGTGSGGISIFNKNSKQFKSINTSHGLPSNNIAALYYVPPYNLWAASGSVISKINLNNWHISRFGPQDGIANIDFTSCRHMYQMNDGRLLVGYTGGFLYFYPGSVNAAGPPFNVSLTGIKVFDRPFSMDSLLQKTDTLHLSYKQNFITIQYASLSYWESNRINYFYKLEGVDKDWVNAHDQRFASYTDLQGGTYTFKVKCENSEAIPCNSITSFVLMIRPAFWQTWWFKTLIVLAITLFLFALYRYRINQLLQLQVMRNEISKDLHDDVGSTLSSIGILSQVAREKMQEGQHEQSSSILSRINTYVQETVEKMGDIVWTVNANHENIYDIVQRLKNAFIETATSKGIHLQFFVDHAFEKQNLPMQVRKNIYLICKEAINNAVKYAGCTKISISYKMSGKKMEIQIADDGRGFNTLRPRAGNGIANMQARASETNGVLKINSGAGGTVLVLSLQIPRNR